MARSSPTTPHPYWPRSWRCSSSVCATSTHGDGGAGPQDARPYVGRAPSCRPCSWWRLPTPRSFRAIPSSWDGGRLPVQHERGLSPRAPARGAESAAGLHLLVVRYPPGYDVQREWAYNGAEIDRGRIVWAHDLGPYINHELLRYFGARRGLDPGVGGRLSLTAARSGRLRPAGRLCSQRTPRSGDDRDRAAPSEAMMRPTPALPTPRDRPGFERLRQ